jgi:DNA-binding NarL/FixJ family response regulator
MGGGNMTETKTKTSARRVLIVDDHPIVREGLTQLIDQQSDLSVCGQACDVEEAQRAIAALQPDVVVLDLGLRDSDGLDVLRDLRRHNRTLPVLILSMRDEDIYAERLLSAGANGYIMKQAAADQLLVALRRVLAGGVYVSERVGASLIRRFATAAPAVDSDPVARLSNRELQVIHLIGHGKATREIAAKLNLSVKTIESHRQRIKKKLNLANAPQLVQFAVSWCSDRH